MTEQCSTCRFWLGRQRASVCRLHPTYVPRSYDDWCGQYEMSEAERIRQRKEQDALFEKHRDCWNKPKCLHGDDKECPYQGIPF